MGASEQSWTVCNVAEQKLFDIEVSADLAADHCR